MKIKELDKLTNRIERRIKREYRKSVNNILNQMRIYNQQGVLDIDDMRKYNRIDKLKNTIETEIKKLQRDSRKQLREGLRDIYKESYTRELELFKKKTSRSLTGINFSQLDTKKVTLALSNPFDLVGWEARLNRSLSETIIRLQSDLGQGLTLGESYTDIANRIMNTIDVKVSDAERIARTEGHRINSVADIEAINQAESLGLKIKRIWLTAEDGRVRDSHSDMEGQVANEDGLFNLDGRLVEGPGLTGVAGEDINCRCVIITEIEEE